ncbi:MAG: hypothetical protein ACXV8L_00960 [Ilumatobacteraceae bacterium]
MLVQRAASILEEELATGIDAAQRLETRFVDIEATRARDDDALVLRFRRDAHEIIDILMDLVDVATGGVGRLAGRAIRITGLEEVGDAPSPRVRNGSGRVAVLEVADPIPSGERGEVQMSIENDDHDSIESFALVSSGLVSDRGDHIGPDLIEFDPPQFDLAAQSAQRVTVTVAVPAAAPPGAYSGIVQTTKLEGVRAVLVVNVV